jgi:hypothetical protein
MKQHASVLLSRISADGVGSSQSVDTLLADLEVLRAALSLRKHQIAPWLAMQRAVCEYVDLEERLKARMHFAPSRPEATRGHRQESYDEETLERAFASASGAIITIFASLDNRQRGMFATTVQRVFASTSSTMS